MRWLVVVVFVVACGKSDKATPKRSAVPCDPAKPTQEWAYAEYRATGDEPYEPKDLRFVERGSGVHQLIAHPCCDIPPRTIGFYWRCRRFESAHALAREVLLDQGWAKADATKRVELATAIDKLLLARGLDQQPKDWNPHKAFRAPTAEALSDGGVKLVRWVFVVEGGGVGGTEEFYALQEQTIGADAKIGSATEVERFAQHRSGLYADPKVLASCDPEKPPTAEWAYALYVDAGGATKPEDVKLDNIHEHVWAQTESGRAHPLRYVRKCKAVYMKQDLVPLILADAGWANADTAKRTELATALDRALLAKVVTAQPADWDPAHPFKPPASEKAPDGGIKLTRWVEVGPNDGYIGGEPQKYRLVTETFQASGKLGTAYMHDHFEPKR